MANSHSYEKKWKYLSIGLMAVLAVGFVFPQAFAAPIDSVLTIVQDIQAKVNAIKAKTDNLPTDPASQLATGKPTGRNFITLFEGELGSIIPAPPSGHERTAMLTLISTKDHQFVDIGLREGGSASFVLNTILDVGKPVTVVVNVPEGKELVASVDDDGDLIANPTQATAIWWESAMG